MSAARRAFPSNPFITPLVQRAASVTPIVGKNHSTIIRLIPATHFPSVTTLPQRYHNVTQPLICAWPGGRHGVAVFRDVTEVRESRVSEQSTCSGTQFSLVGSGDNIIVCRDRQRDVQPIGQFAMHPRENLPLITVNLRGEATLCFAFS